MRRATDPVSAAVTSALDTMPPDNFEQKSPPQPSDPRLPASPSKHNELASALAAPFDLDAAGVGVMLRTLLAWPARVPESLLVDNMPDPFALRLTATSPGGVRTQGLWLIATSNNLPHAFPLYRWNEARACFDVAEKDGRHLCVFPEGHLPAWWNRGEPVPTEPDLPADLLFARWAPEIFEFGERLVLFYTARDRQGVLRSAYATSRCIEGPWTDHGPLDVNPRVKELVPDYPGENLELGTIDGTLVRFEDSSGRKRHALVVKVDGNALRWVDPITGQKRVAPTPLVAREFTFGEEGALRFVGTPHVILSDGPQHGGLVEGQFFVRENGQLYVIYSAGFFGNHEYRTYVGKIDDVLHGEVRDERLLMDSQSPALGGAWNGPGHPSLEKLGDGLYALYLHAWRNGTDYVAHGEARKVLRFHLSFRDEHGQACEPFVVEDRQGSRGAPRTVEAA
ncbi:family 43 glycosylhydrolase [Cystobacter fuscus]|uniref:family 43 glycosylhydrolase n=1 Tax=Cystobacter fuscus TaxID=43 RepID=UPI0012DD0D39|nr:family 43 glycosylhydrolase [Cystobacter fuscus]